MAHSEAKALSLAAAEIVPAATSMAPGICGVGTGGRQRPSLRVTHHSALIPKSRVSPRITPEPKASPSGRVSASPIAPRANEAHPALAAPPAGPSERRVELSRIAFARSGDKGDAANIGVGARSPALYATLVREVTPQAVRAHLGHLMCADSSVAVYALPASFSVNVLITKALGGVSTARVALFIFLTFVPFEHRAGCPLWCWTSKARRTDSCSCPCQCLCPHHCFPASDKKTTQIQNPLFSLARWIYHLLCRLMRAMFGGSCPPFYSHGMVYLLISGSFTTRVTLSGEGASSSRPASMAVVTKYPTCDRLSNTVNVDADTLTRKNFFAL